MTDGGEQPEKPLVKGDVRGDVRGEDGRYMRGHSGGPGNPHARQINQLRAALYAAVTVEDVRDIAAGLIKKAREKGDAYAASVLFDRLFGKAPQAIELSGPDGEPITTANLNLALLTIDELNALRTLFLKAAGK